MADALIGDSQSDGLEAPLTPLLGLVFAEPHVGWSTARVLGEPLDRALASRASRVIAVVGGNDDPLNLEAFVAGARKARAARKQLVIVGPVFARTDDSSRHDRARIALRAASIAAGVRFIDAYPLTQDLARPTNVHLGPGYPEYARRLEKVLNASAFWPLTFSAVAALIAYRALR